jgi:hypothetical protein
MTEFGGAALLVKTVVEAANNRARKNDQGARSNQRVIMTTVFRDTPHLLK